MILILAEVPIGLKENEFWINSVGYETGIRAVLPGMRLNIKGRGAAVYKNLYLCVTSNCLCVNARNGWVAGISCGHQLHA